MTSFPQAALLSIVVRALYHHGRRQQHDGFLRHTFAISPWLGAVAVALIVLGCLLLVLIKGAGRVVEGTPWYVRLALLATAGFGMFWLLKVIRDQSARRAA